MNTAEYPVTEPCAVTTKEWEGDPTTVLLLALRDGDDRAMTELMRKHRNPLIRTIKSKVKNQEDAEDICQGVFLKIYTARARYEANAKGATYLYRIAMHDVITYLRNRRSERHATDPLDVGDVSLDRRGSLRDPRPNIEQAILKEEGLSAIREALAKIPEPIRGRLVANKWEELSYQEIIDKEGGQLSLTAMKSSINRGYDRLRQELNLTKFKPSSLTKEERAKRERRQARFLYSRLYKRGGFFK